MIETSMDQKIGQMIMTGFPGPSINPEFRQLVADCKIGNVIFFSRNIQDRLQVSRLCEELQDLISANTGLPPFITVDQEGGMVTRLPEDCTNIPGAMTLTATGEPENARLAGRITARELNSVGINVDIAPVLDINSNPRNPVIGVRSYGDSDETVTLFGQAMMQGLLDEGIMPVIKHFPGHGDTSVDSHLGLPVIHKTIEALEANELVPFRKAINSGAPCVMSSHILFPSIEEEKVPGTMSRAVITGLLKERLGFDGLVMSDCLEMNAIKDYYGVARGAVAAVKAGIHVVSISHTPEFVREAVKAIKTAVESGEIPVEVIDEAVSKIMEFKKKYARTREQDISVAGCADHREKVRRMSEESITLVQSRNGRVPPLSGSVVFMGCHAGRSTQASDDIHKGFNFPGYMTERLGGDGLIFSLNPPLDEISDILKKTKGYDCVVIGTYNGHLNQGQLELANRLCETNENVIAVALRNPYDSGLIKGCAASLAAYEYTKLSFDALIRVFKGEIIPKGHLPVKL